MAASRSRARDPGTHSTVRSLLRLAASRTFGVSTRVPECSCAGVFNDANVGGQMVFRAVTPTFLSAALRSGVWIVLAGRDGAVTVPEGEV